jgi:hypothetical protein
MHGRIFTSLVLGLLAAALSGCDDERAPPPASEPAPLPDTGSLYRPDCVGSVAGRVTWVGSLPDVPPFRAIPSSEAEKSTPRKTWPNPNAPQIDSDSRAVANAVVFLRGVAPCRGRPWHHEPVRIVHRDYRLQVLQGPADRPFGFVRRGDAVTMVSEQNVFHSLQARGAAFFTRTLPDRGVIASQRLTRRGVVELNSNAGYFWMHGYLFVDDHPYYTPTDREGRFSLGCVPPGEYELVCWLPDWREAGHELDGDTIRVWRLFFRPPREVVRRVSVRTDKVSTIDFTLSDPGAGR